LYEIKIYILQSLVIFSDEMFHIFLHMYKYVFLLVKMYRFQQSVVGMFLKLCALISGLAIDWRANQAVKKRK